MKYFNLIFHKGMEFPTKLARRANFCPNHYRISDEISCGSQISRETGCLHSLLVALRGAEQDTKK